MKRLFIVEDEAIVALELQDHMRSMGYEVCGHAANGQAALAQIPEARPDLILMDINLGNGLTGIDVAEALRGSVDAPVVYVTAYSDAELATRASRTESYAYIVKPFHPHALRATIEMALRRYDAERELEAAHRALRASAERQRAMLAAQPDLVLFVEADGRLVDRYAGDSRLADALPAASPGRTIRESLPAPLALDVERAHVEALRTGRVQTIEFIRPTEAGPRHIEARVAPSGETHTLAMVRDITERKRADEALIESRALLAEAQRLAQIGSWKIDSTTGAVAWTDETRRLHGVLSQDVPPSVDGFVARVHPSDRAAARAWFDALCAGDDHDPVEYRVEDPDGGVRRVRSRGETVRSATGEPQSIVGTTRDITEQRATEDALRASEARHRRLFEDAIEGVFRTRIDGTILDVNPAFARMLGFASPDELRGTNVSALYAERETAPPRLECDSGVDQLDGVEIGWRTKTDAPITVELFGRRLFDEHGNATHYQGFVRDVSERLAANARRQTLEAQLRHAQKMEAVGTLASGIAHDFNNLLAVIFGNLELARDTVAHGHPAIAALDRITCASTRARDLIQQILAFSRKQPAVRQVVRLQRVIDETLRLLRSTVPAGIRIDAALSADAPEVSANPTQIQQVLMNLGTNAWHAIGTGPGRIEIQLDAVSSDAVSTDAVSTGSAALAPGRYARVRVSDDGDGMSAETVERIFEPFFTTKPVGQGSGLGLAVAHGIVEAHEGVITVESAPGLGTTCTLHLPEATDAVEHEDGPAPPPTRTRGGHILYVDDEPMLVGVTRRLLERRGFRATAFTDPVEAAETVRASPNEFDAVVVDHHMPRMSGVELARAIRSQRPNLPIVLVSGGTPLSNEQLAAEGINARLGKPFTCDELVDVLSRAMAPEATKA